MNNPIIAQLQNRCHLETSALRLERRSKEIKEALKQARFQKRACDEKLLLYDGSFRKFLDRLSGKQLEENHTALMELRRLMRGDRAGEILSIAEQQEIYAAPDRRGEACKPLLLRLKADLTGLGIFFEPGGYFESPTAFIVSAAAAHNRLDRVNQALDQVEDTQRQLRRLKEQLEE